MLSLICSCFYPEPRNISIYTYDGEFTPERLPLGWGEGVVLSFLPPSSSSDRMNPSLVELAPHMLGPAMRPYCLSVAQNTSDVGLITGLYVGTG